MWVSEDRRLRYEKPLLYEISGESKCSKLFKSGCECKKDKLVHFKFSTMPGNLEKITGEPKCSFREYKLERLKRLKYQLQKGLKIFESNFQGMSEAEKTVITELTTSVQQVIDSADSVFTPFTQLLPTRECFTNAGINNTNI